MCEVSKEDLEWAHALLMERNPVTADDHVRVVAEAIEGARQEEREACAQIARDDAEANRRLRDKLDLSGAERVELNRRIATAANIADRIMARGERDR